MIKRLVFLAGLIVASPANATIFIDGGNYNDYKQIVIPFASVGFLVYYYESIPGNDWKIVFVSPWGGGLVVWCGGPGRLPPNFKSDYAAHPIVQLSDMTAFPTGWSSGNSLPAPPAPPAPVVTSVP